VNLFLSKAFIFVATYH